MSNIVHKVKDAMTDRDKPVTRSQAADDRHRSAGNPFTPNYNTSQNAPRTNNPANMDSNANRPEFADYNSGSGPDMKTQNNQYENYPTSTTTESRAGQPSSNPRNPTSTTGDTTSSASSADMNAGPHRSNLANKLDPRVDSDLDNRANQATTGSQRSNVGAQGMNPSNMPQQQSSDQGLDRHTSSDDNFSKSTEEHRSHRQPGQYNNTYDQAGGGTEEADFNSSTQEHKSHKTSSHMAPCTSNTAGGGPMPQNNAAESNFGGNAAGGSSYNQNMGAGGQEGQYTNPPQKSNAGANLPPEQQNMAGGQRVGY